VEIRHTDLFVGGEWVPGSAGRLTVIDPATGAPLAEVANASVADCERAVAAADRAFPAWRRTAPRERAEILRRAFEIMIAEADVLAAILTAEMGKPLAEARGEIAYAAEFFRWFSEEAVRIDGDYRRAPGGANWILTSREPVGVALLATPWNFPAAMITRKVGPALAAGCTVVVKPAQDTPLTALAIADVLARAGVPAGVVNVVVTDPPGPPVETMLAGGVVRKLSFTGSTRVGAMLLAQAAPRVVNCSMELGGNAPFIVLADADVTAAVDGAMVAKMRNGGAACTAANRFYVHAAVAEEFVDRFVARMSAVVLGAGTDPATSLGPMISAGHQRRLAEAVDSAVARGARVACGGAPVTMPAFGYPATVLTDVSADDPILADEIFGPVAPIVVLDATDDEFVARANAVEHGLVSYVYSGDAGRAMRVAERLECGMVGLNRGLVSDPAAPFGGVKASGLGREGAHDGLLAFLETKYVAGNW